MITLDFQLTLAGHKRWLADHPDGSRANLSLQELAAINYGGANLEQAKLTGLDDVNSFYTEAAPAALRQPFAGCRIAAVHSPEVADLAARASIELYLCGRAHSGQVCQPWGGPLISYLRRYRAYNCELWHHGDMSGYTSNGAGVTGTPLRYNCPPELALITLRQPLKDLD